MGIWGQGTALAPFQGLLDLSVTASFLGSGHQLYFEKCWFLSSGAPDVLAVTDGHGEDSPGTSPMGAGVTRLIHITEQQPPGSTGVDLRAPRTAVPGAGSQLSRLQRETLSVCLMALACPPQRTDNPVSHFAAVRESRLWSDIAGCVPGCAPGSSGTKVFLLLCLCIFRKGVVMVAPPGTGRVSPWAVHRAG